MRKLVIAALLLLESTFCAIQAQVKIMTQNMDEGTNDSYVLEFADTQLQLGVDLTLAEILASNIPARAAALASRIAVEKPDLLGLQEAALWRVGPTPATANNVLYDQLQILLQALSAQGVTYNVVAVNNLTDIALPATSGALRLTDRDALLVRADAAPSTLQILSAQTHIFSAALPFEGAQVTAGWISADITAGGVPFKFVTTHLLSSVPGVPEATLIQVAQTQELLAALSGVTEPILISGDLNSDANFGNGPDATPSVGLIEAAGYKDDWKLVHPSDPGETWPLFLQDQTPPHFFASSSPFERIDLFFSKGISVLGEERIFAPVHGIPDFGSDHAGVIGLFKP